jgi:hypothetical protein
MLGVLLRFAHVLVVAAFVGQVTGFVPPVESQACEQNCPGEDESDDGCEQSCQLCTCCPSLRLTASAPTVGVSPQPVLGRVEWELRERPAAPPPRDIFHVPKHYSA